MECVRNCVSPVKSRDDHTRLILRKLNQMDEKLDMVLRKLHRMSKAPAAYWSRSSHPLTVHRESDRDGGRQILIEWFWLTRNYCHYRPWRQNGFKSTIFRSYRLYCFQGQVKSQSNSTVFCEQRCWYSNKSFCNVCPTVAWVLLPSLVSLHNYSY